MPAATFDPDGPPFAGPTAADVEGDCALGLARRLRLVSLLDLRGADDALSSFASSSTGDTR